MKKVILSVLVAGALLSTSCKEAKKEANDVKGAAVEATEKVAEETKAAADKVAEATGEAAEKVAEGAEKAAEDVKEAVDGAKEAVQNAVAGITIPEFKDPKVGEYLTEYAKYAEDFAAAKGDALKQTSLAKKGADLATKAQGIVGSLDAESAKKFSDVMTAIQAKMTK